MSAARDPKLVTAIADALSDGDATDVTVMVILDALAVIRITRLGLLLAADRKLLVCARASACADSTNMLPSVAQEGCMKAEDRVIMDILLRYVEKNREDLREIARAPAATARVPAAAAPALDPLAVKTEVLQAVSDTVADEYLLFFQARSAARDASAKAAVAKFDSTWIAGDHDRNSLFDVVLKAARDEVAQRIRDDAAFAATMDETHLDELHASDAAGPPPPASGAAGLPPPPSASDAAGLPPPMPPSAVSVTVPRVDVSAPFEPPSSDGVGVVRRRGAARGGGGSRRNVDAARSVCLW